jgi:hypothetical protein
MKNKRKPNKKVRNLNPTYRINSYTFIRIQNDWHSIIKNLPYVKKFAPDYNFLNSKWII